MAFTTFEELGRRRSRSRSSSGIGPEQQQSLIRRIGNKSLGGLSAAGNFLDLPGSIVRDLLTWAPGGIKARNPFDQVLTPFSAANRTTGRDLLRSAGIIKQRNTTGNAIGGALLSAALDPLTYLTLGGAAVTSAGRVAKNAGLFDDVVRVANLGNTGRQLGRSQARATTTLRDLIREGGPGAARRAATAARSRGVRLSDIADQSVGGMTGLGIPFRDPSLVFGGAGRAGRTADSVGQAVAHGRFSPVPLIRQHFDARVREAGAAPFQQAAMGVTRSVDESRVANKSAMFDQVQSYQRAVPNPDDHVATRRFLEGIVQPPNQAAAEVIGQVRSRDAANLTTKQQAGAMAPEMTGEFVSDHASRYASTPERSGAGRSRTLNYDDPANLRRREFLKNWEGGTGSIMEAMSDPGIRALRQRGASQSEFEQYIRANYGDRFWEVRNDIANGILPRNPEWRTHLARFQPTMYSRANAQQLSNWLEGGATPAIRLEARAQDAARTATDAVVEFDSSFRGRIMTQPGWENSYRTGSASFIAENHHGNLVPTIRSVTIPQSQRLTPAAERQISALKAQGWTDTVSNGVRRLTRPDNAPNTLPQVRSSAERISDFASFVRRAPDEALDQRLFGNHPFVDAWRASDSASVVAQSANAATQTLATLLQNPQAMAQVVRRSGTSAGDAVELPRALQAAGLDVGSRSSPGRVMQNLAAQLGRPADQVFDLQIPSVVRDELIRPLRAFQGPLPAGRALELYDSYLNLTKGYLTGLFPAFHSRNLTSGQARNFLRGMFSGRDVRRAGQLLAGRAHGSMGDLAAIPVVRQRLRQKGLPVNAENAANEVRQMVAENSLVGRHTGIANDMVGSAGADTIRNTATTEGILDEFIGSNPLGVREFAQQAAARTPGTTLNPIAMRGVAGREASSFGPAAAMEDLGFGVEGLNRVGPFIQQIRRGVDPTEAARRVKRAQVDYSNRAFTRFENDVMRRLFPFFKFTRANTPEVLRELIRRPGGKTAQAIRTVNSLRDSTAMTPDYVAETASIPLTGRLGGGPGNDRYLTGLGLMFEDPLSFLSSQRPVQSGLLETGSRLTPPLKAAAEWATGQSFFQRGPLGGRSIEDLDPTVGRLLANINDYRTGERTRRADPVLGSRALEFILGNSPASRVLTTGRMLSDPRKGAAAKALNALTGARISDVGPAAQEAILREKLGDFSRALGGRNFVRQYLPAEVVEQLPPAQQLEAMQIQAMLNELARRAKARASQRRN